MNYILNQHIVTHYVIGINKEMKKNVEIDCLILDFNQSDS